MPGENRFQSFAEQIMARYSGFGYGYEPAALQYLEDTQQGPQEEAAAGTHITNNLYHIRNIKEENYLFQQNLSFLTQILENQVYQKLYPSVEKQIEKLIHSKMPEAETKLVRQVSEQLTTLVKQGGIEQLEAVREKVLTEHKEILREREKILSEKSVLVKEQEKILTQQKELLKEQEQVLKEHDIIIEKNKLQEQETLFRQIENIWNSSVYSTTVNQNIRNQFGYNGTQLGKKPAKLAQQAEERNISVDSSVQNHLFQQHTDREISFLERTSRIVNNQQQMLEQFRYQSPGNLGLRLIAQYPAQTNHDVKREMQKQSGQAGPIHSSMVLEYEMQPDRMEESDAEVLQLTAKQQKAAETQRQSELQKTVELQKQSEVLKTVETQVRSEVLKTVETQVLSEVQKTMDAQKNVDVQKTEEKSDVMDASSDIRQVFTKENINVTEMMQKNSVTPSLSFTEMDLTYAESVNSATNHSFEQPAVEAHIVEEIVREKIEHDPTKLYERIIDKTIQAAEHRTTEQNAAMYQQLKLEYPTEDSQALHQEMIQMVQTEMQQVPRVPAVVNKSSSDHMVRPSVGQGELIIRSRQLSEQILEHMEQAGMVPAATIKTAAKTVALRQLSSVILQYAESEASEGSDEELQTAMVRVLEHYQAGQMREAAEGPRSTAIRQVLRKNVIVPATDMDTAPIVYRSEETTYTEQQEKTALLEKQVKEVVRDLKTVEEKTIVHKEEILEQQKKVAREVLSSQSVNWTEGENGRYLRNEVQQSVEEQLNQSVNQIANRVYRRLEEKLRSERGRRGLI